LTLALKREVSGNAPVRGSSHPPLDQSGITQRPATFPIPATGQRGESRPINQGQPVRQPAATRLNLACVVIDYDRCDHDSAICPDHHISEWGEPAKTVDAIPCRGPPGYRHLLQSSLSGMDSGFCQTPEEETRAGAG